MTAIPARQLSLFKGKRQKGELPKSPLEFEIQCALADTLRKGGCVKGWIWTAFPAGEERPSFIDSRGRRVSPSGDRLKRQGLNPGFFDMLFISPTGIHHWLELKRDEKAKLSEEQAAFSLAMIARGVPCEVAHSYDQAVVILRRWGALRVTVTA
jgi:hypothetical protein